MAPSGCGTPHTTQGDKTMSSTDDRPQVGPEGAQEQVDGWTGQSTRKGFLKGAAVLGAGATGLGALTPAAALAKGKGGLTHGDLKILKAAQIAEALAVT